MKSLCVKTNDPYVISYLQESFENINLENVYISIRKFKHFNNIIIHYLGDDNIDFYFRVSNYISKAIIQYYEKELVYNNIIFNYFYFSSSEKRKIINNSFILLSEEKNMKSRYDYIKDEIFNELASTHSIFIQGIINFKLRKYLDFINNQIEIAVNKFLIDKEYLEFVNILKLYIKSETPNSKINHLHLIYNEKNSIIIDDNKNIISYNDSIKKTKYISDISFSSNDLALNTLLSLVPASITVHLIDNYIDEFINTLKLIFDDRVKLCKHCDICLFYRQKYSNKL